MANIYTVSTGGKEYTYKSHHAADPVTIAAVTVHKKSPKAMGMVIEVSGGHLSEPVYIMTQTVCERLGMWAVEKEG